MTGMPLTTGEAPVTYSAQSEEGKVPVGYKLTEVGVIPVDWVVEPLSQVLDFRNGVNANKEAYGRGIPFINVLEVISKSHLLVSDIQGKVSLPQNLIDSYAIKHGDMLFNRTSETQDEVGLAAVYLGDTPIVFGGFVIRGRLVSRTEFHSEYVGYAFRAPFIRKQIIARGQGAIRSNIGQADLRKVILPIPTVAEQQAIAEALSDVDGLLGGLEKLIAKKRAIKTGAMQQLLTGKTRLPGFGKGQGYKQTEVGEIPEDWEVTLLLDVADVRDGTHDSPKYISEGVPLVTSKNIIYGSVDLTEVSYISEDDAFEINKRSKVDSGDILMSMIGSIGAVAQVPNDPQFCIKNVALIKPKNITEHYLVKLLESDFYQRYISDNLDGGIQKFISLNTLRGLDVIVPEKKEQKAIAKVLSDMDQEIAALETRLAKTKSLKQGMMQELLTGKTRLV